MRVVCSLADEGLRPLVVPAHIPYRGTSTKLPTALQSVARLPRATAGAVLCWIRKHICLWSAIVIDLGLFCYQNCFHRPAARETFCRTLLYFVTVCRRCYVEPPKSSETGKT